jgi:DNA modification methylase
VSSAERPDDIGTIPTTPNFCESCGSALRVTAAPINQDDAARAADGNDPVQGTRFWYTSKASGSDRTERGAVKNGHPTVKPVDLMRWLCRLVTPPGGLILDPFCGSGSTGVAALAEGFRFVGIEQDENYVAIAERRLAEVAPLFKEHA